MTDDRKRTVIDLGYVVAVVGPEGQATMKLTLMEPAVSDDDTHIPAASICVYGAGAIMALRDGLIAAFPVKGDDTDD